MTNTDTRLEDVGRELNRADLARLEELYHALRLQMVFILRSGPSM